MNLPLVSVGSGNGFFEWLLCLFFPRLKMIMVDPEPNKYNKIPDEIVDYMINIKPKEFSYLKTGQVNEHYRKYITDLNEPVIGNCNVLINWPVNDCTYDYDSVIHLRPRKFIFIISPYENNKFTQLTRSGSFFIHHTIRYDRKFVRSVSTRAYTTIQCELAMFEKFF